jgi:hypothetical protein
MTGVSLSLGAWSRLLSIIIKSHNKQLRIYENGTTFELQDSIILKRYENFTKIAAKC